MFWSLLIHKSRDSTNSVVAVRRVSTLWIVVFHYCDSEGMVRGRHEEGRKPSKTSKIDENVTFLKTSKMDKRRSEFRGKSGLDRPS